MKIIIPTKGRVHNQLTISNLPKELRNSMQIVCPEHEVRWHTSHFPDIEIIVQPDPSMGISLKRKWIMENTKEDKIVMLDDDLRFAVRRDDLLFLLLLDRHHLQSQRHGE